MSCDSLFLWVHGLTTVYVNVNLSCNNEEDIIVLSDSFSAYIGNWQESFTEKTHFKIGKQ